MGGVYVPVGGGRRPRGILREQDDRIPGFSRRDYLEPDEFDAAVDAARATAVGLVERIRAGRRRARPAGRRVPALVRPLADLPQGAAVTALGHEDERAAAGCDRRARHRLRRGRRRHGQDRRARRAVRDARWSTTGWTSSRSSSSRTPSARRASFAPASARGSSSAAGRTSRSSSTAPGSPRSTASAGASSARTRSRRASIPRFRVLDEPQALVLQAEAFSVALERFCAADEPDRWQLLATYGAAGLRRMLVEVYATLRSAGRDLVLEASEVGCRSPSGSTRCARPQRCLLADERATEAQHGAACAALDLLAADALPERLLPLLDLKVRGPRAAGVRRGARRSRRDGARGARHARPRAPPGAAHGVRGGVRGGEGRASRRSTSRISSSARATCCATTPDPRARAGAVPLDHGRRVPGHEPPPDRAARPPRRRRRRPRPLPRRRRVPVDLRIPARRRRRLPRAPRGRTDGAAADPELPLAAGGARGGERALRRGVRRRVPAARAGRRPRRVRAAHGVRAARHGQGGRGRGGRPLAPLRGPTRRAARARARRRGRRDPRRDRPPLRRGHGRRVVRGGAPSRGAARRTAPPGATTSASSRSSTCSPT